ncbi:hypothetical protein [Luteibacter sp.]|uniref:hypothetical protein n=1 Tax=Luteibacter sp. TaxID=1886636 RepID=UPI00280BC7A0|nr:hypothetical protein [Luteibacter sp.]
MTIGDVEALVGTIVSEGEILPRLARVVDIGVIGTALETTVFADVSALRNAAGRAGRYRPDVAARIRRRIQHLLQIERERRLQVTIKAASHSTPGVFLPQRGHPVVPWRRRPR